MADDAARSWIQGDSIRMTSRGELIAIGTFDAKQQHGSSRRRSRNRLNLIHTSLQRGDRHAPYVVKPFQRLTWKPLETVSLSVPYIITWLKPGVNETPTETTFDLCAPRVNIGFP